MRELKFRAFHKPSKEMVDVYALFGSLIFVDIKNDTIPLARQDCELMQYTGLKDVEGKEIYEGDIIVIPDQFYNEGELDHYVGIVEFISSSWKYTLKCVDSERVSILEGLNDMLNAIGYIDNAKTHFKVIGNIYENKELVK